MGKFFFILLLLILPVFHSVAQSKYLEGYIVTVQDDTLKGYINESRLENAVDEVMFKPTLSTEPRQYTPLEVGSFLVSPTAETFIGKVLPIDKTPVATDKLLEAESPMEFLRVNRPQVDTIFLELLTKGRMSLYRYSNEKVHYFIHKEGGDWQELISQRYMLKTNGIKNIVTVEAYKDQLALQLSDCPKVAKLARTTTYSETGLKNVIGKYNACMGEVPVASKEIAKNRARFGVVASISSTTLTIHHPNELKFAPSAMPAAGVSLNLPLQRRLRNWSYSGEAAYKGFRAENNRVTFDMKYIRFNNMLRYQYLKGFVQPFVQGGFSVSYAFRRNQSYRSTTPYRTESVFLPIPKPMEYGFVSGVGMQVKRFSLEGRFETAMGIMSNYKNAMGNTRSVFLLLGYQIK